MDGVEIPIGLWYVGLGFRAWVQNLSHVASNDGLGDNDGLLLLQWHWPWYQCSGCQDGRWISDAFVLSLGFPVFPISGQDMEKFLCFTMLLSRCM